MEQGHKQKRLLLNSDTPQEPHGFCVRKHKITFQSATLNISGLPVHASVEVVTARPMNLLDTIFAARVRTDLHTVIGAASAKAERVSIPRADAVVLVGRDGDDRPKGAVAVGTGKGLKVDAAGVGIGSHVVDATYETLAIIAVGRQDSLLRI